MIATGPGWELRLGDCIEGMRELHDEQIDVTIADPPYEAAAHNKMRRVKKYAPRASTHTDGMIACLEPLPFDPITEEQRSESAWHIARVTKRWCLVFCQVEAAGKWADALTSAPFGLEYIRTMVWVKPDGQPQFTGDRPGVGYESIVVAHRKGRKRWNGGGKTGVFNFPKQESRDSHVVGGIHPTKKPLPLMRELVELFSEPNDLILDPFAGAGSTGLAATQLNRRFLGFELNRDYFDIACRRLRGEEAKPRLEQPSLF